MSKAMKVIEGEIADNGEPKAKSAAKRKLEVVPESAEGMGVIERLVLSGASIETIERVIAMNERQEDRNAQVAFNAAMAQAQAELVPVARNQKNKQTGNNYADLAAIAAAAMPIIHAHGFFAVTSEFQSLKPDHLGVALDVGHSGGHSKHYEFNIPWDGAGLKGNTNKTPTHAYASTLAYGERYAKCKVFGIATKDDDGNAAGAKPTELVSDEQAEAIKNKILEVKADVAKLLEMGGVESVSDIKACDYQKVMDLLELKKNKRA